MDNNVNNTLHTTKLSTPGERLRYIRNLAQLTRESIKEKFNISSATLRSWEDGKVGISDEKIKICLEAYKSIGILTNIEWVRTGEGMHPLIQGKAPKFIEQLLISNDDHYNDNKFDKASLRDETKNSENFISYIDKNERFVFINEKYHEIFNKTTNEIVGKTLLELIGEQGYEANKPYVARALQGEEVTFEYPWKYNENNYRYLKLHFIPHKVEDKIVGFFSFIEDKEISLESYFLSRKIEELMSTEPTNDIEYDHKLYISCIEILEELIKELNVKANINIMNKVALTFYLYSKEKNIVDKDYAINMLKMLKDLKFFK